MHLPQDPDCIFLFCRLATMVSTEYFVYSESSNLPIRLFEIGTRQNSQGLPSCKWACPSACNLI